VEPEIQLAETDDRMLIRSATHPVGAPKTSFIMRKNAVKNPVLD